ncbi:XkdX family protein [Leuconostoc citreum]|uniref:XkdX family protein n=1 Tax=Leuconostoc citreum TaxID=33964 RepID=UPI0032DEE815
MFDMIKEFYELKLYNKDDMKLFVVGMMITASQYEAIMGEPYEEPTGERYD